MPIINGKLYLSPQKIAEKFGVSRIRIYQLIKQNRIPGVLHLESNYLILAESEFAPRKRGRPRKVPQYDLRPNHDLTD